MGVGTIIFHFSRSEISDEFLYCQPLWLVYREILSLHYTHILWRLTHNWTCSFNLHSPRWRHQMETFFALLALCEGNSPVTGEFPSQRPVTRSFAVFFDLRLNKRLNKQSRRRDLKRHRAHYDVTVIQVVWPNSMVSGLGLFSWPITIREYAFPNVVCHDCHSV